MYLRKLIVGIAHYYLRMTGLILRQPKKNNCITGNLASEARDPGGMNGLDLAREIGERFTDIPVLLTTGYSASAQDAVRQGVVVLQKPYDLESLRRNIREAIEGTKARRQQAAPAG